MSAHTDAAAHGSSITLVCMCCMLVIVSTSNNYSRQQLLDIGLKIAITVKSRRSYNIPTKIARPPGAPWIVVSSSRRWRRRRERKQKKGCRSGVLTRLRKDLHKPPLPSMFVSNARSLIYKKDKLELLAMRNHYVQDYCVITETWLHLLIPDTAVQVAGHTTHRWDRNKDSGKSSGGGLCIYIHDNWGSDNISIHRHCSLDLESITIRCNPFFLPWKNASVFSPTRSPG